MQWSQLPSVVLPHHWFMRGSSVETLLAHYGCDEDNVDNVFPKILATHNHFLRRGTVTPAARLGDDA